jgi:hypothetical protein
VTKLRPAVLLLVVVLAACGGDEAPAPISTTTIASAAPGWDARALATAARLADAARASGVACDAYEPYPYTTISNDYARGHLPLPAAMASCTSTGDENLTFEVFADRAAADAFVAAKMAAICATARAKGIPNATVPYVAGDGWLVEPDEKGTADRLATILVGESRLATCP